MRKRRFVIYLLLALLLAFTVSLSWSLYTRSGTAFVLRAIEGAMSDTLELKKVTGRIGYSLHLEGLTVKLQDLTIIVQTADLKWNPLYLAGGKLAISSLRMQGISIKGVKSPEEKPVGLRLPELPRWFRVFEAWINELIVNGLSYRTDESEPVTVKSILAIVRLDMGILYLQGLDAKSTYGNLTGSAAVNLLRPALQARLAATLPEVTAGIDGISVDTNLSPSRGGEQIAGPLVLKAFSAKQERASLRCTVGIARQALRISELKMLKAGEKGTLEAEGRLDLSGENPAFSISARFAGLDLFPEVPLETDLSGKLAIAGTTEDFKGSFDLKNSGPHWKEIELAGGIYGDGAMIELQGLEARVLGGAILGSAKMLRGPATILTARFTGKGLDPARMRPGLEGNLNFELKGQLKTPGKEPMEGSITAAFRNSRFQKRALSADLDLTFGEETIKVNTLAVKGNGFGATAAGVVQERLSWEVRIEDASKLLPGAKGRLFANGWARWRDNEASGVLRAQGRKISYDATSISSLDAVIKMPDGYKGDVAVDITGRGISHGILRADALNLAVNGAMGDHRIVLASAHDRDRIDLLAEGKYADEAWQGTVLKLSGTQAPFGAWGLDAPAKVNVSKKKLSLSRLVLTGLRGEMIDLSADLTLEPMIGFAAAKWQRVDLARANKLLGQAQLQGSTSGSSRIVWSSGKRLALSAEIDASGGFSQGSMKVRVDRLGCRLNWDRSGLLGSLDVSLGTNQGQANVRIASRQPAALSPPTQGYFEAAWNSMDMALLQPLLGENIFLKGLLSGEARGSLLPDNRFDLSGQTRVSGGSLAWRSEEGELSAPLREASVAWTWKGASLRGKMDLALERYGRAGAAFEMPLAARLPLAAEKGSPIAISMRGAMSEKGLLAALFPGMAQETRSQIDFDLTAGGTIADPAINGRLDLKGANAYLPSAGIHVKNVSAGVLFDNNRITLSSVASSGQGLLRINGSADHKKGRITSYKGTLKGERFQAVDLPELKASVSPDISFSGNMEQVTIRGSVLIPELLVQEEHKETLIKPSADVIIEGRREKEEKALPFAIDMVVSVILGDKVFVKAYGIDTRLAGKVNIAMKDPDDVRASGTISTVKGKFDAYGVKLDIRRGNISFGGGPVDRANLDILALRTVSDVSAGVLVAGTPAAPLISLYSQPPMTDTDILSYIVLGRASGTAGKNDTALLARAASGLLTGGKSSAIQKQLGLDVVDIESADGDVSKSIVKVGKYLSPKLFISYGRSIYTGENIFGIRYSLTKRLEVESTMGNQSGAAIYYRIEFN